MSLYSHRHITMYGLLIVHTAATSSACVNTTLAYMDLSRQLYVLQHKKPNQHHASGPFNAMSVATSLIQSAPHHVNIIFHITIQSTPHHVDIICHVTVVLPSQLPRHVDVIGLVSAMPTIWPDT
jgi:hypothetical protein